MYRSARAEMRAEFAAESRLLPTGVPTPADVLLLLQTASAKPRDYLMIRILYFAGLRRHELLGLRVGDVLWDLRTLFIRAGKGDKDRYVLLDSTTLALLREWVGSAPPEQQIFPISHFWSDNNFKKYAEQCGLYQSFKARGLRLSVHSMRHAFATHHYERGLEFWIVLSLLGHTFIETTAVYLRTASRQIATAYSSSNPFRTLTGKAADSNSQPVDPAGNAKPDWPEAKELAREFISQPDAARPNGLPSAPTPAEMSAILEVARCCPEHYLVLRTLYASGLWLQELLQLEPEHVLWDEQQLLVGGRKVCIDAETLALLKARPLSPGSRLFPLTGPQVEEFLRAYATQIGLAQRLEGTGRAFSADCIRYAFATHCCLNDIDRISLMNLLGHRFVSTSDGYFRSAAARFLPAYVAAGQHLQEPKRRNPG